MASGTRACEFTLAGRPGPIGAGLCRNSSPIHSGLLLCPVGKTIGDTRRTRVDPTIEDEAAARAGAAARATCDVGTLHGTYLFAGNGVFAPTANLAKNCPAYSRS